MSDEFRILVGTLPGDGWGFTKRVKLYARPRLKVITGPRMTVIHEPIEDPMRFAMTSDYISPTGRELGGGILSAEGLKEVDRPEIDTTSMAALLDLIPWHLNDMQAACAHQTVVYEVGKYGRQMSLTDTPPCAVSGYRLGSAWLVKPLTVEAVDLCRSLGVTVPAGGTVFND